MTLHELLTVVSRAAWFSRLGEFPEREDAVPLAAVASSDGWDWLPTSREHPDPIHGQSLVELAEQEGKDTTRREAEQSIVKAVLASLSSVPDTHPGLVDGPHDLTLAAKRGAQYAARMAAREIIVGRPGFWCGVVREYERGFWPCGLFDGGHRLVIY